ncbi:hypothetical protein LINGRAHAP2_LOCUS19288 [Linum grandiflorum]
MKKMSPDLESSLICAKSCFCLNRVFRLCLLGEMVMSCTYTS